MENATKTGKPQNMRKGKRGCIGDLPKLREIEEEKARSQNRG